MKRPHLPLRIHLDVGRNEGNNVMSHGQAVLAAHRQMRDVLILKGHRLTYWDCNGGHDFENWH